MNKEIRRVGVVVLAMFVALLCSTSIIQVISADGLDADARNTRTLTEAYDVQRGTILVNGQPIAQSVPSQDSYKFQRVYSNGALYSSVTGFDPINGAPTGIEGALNTQLSGASDSQFLDRLNAIVTGKNPAGENVNLTIDPVAQQAAYDALGDQRGAVVLLQPKTGRVLAMVSKPDYDPNALATHNTAQANATYQTLLDQANDPLINRTISGNLNPPGSTFKPIMSSAAFGSGKYTPQSTLPNLARLTLPGSNTIVYNDTHAACGSGTTVTIEQAQVLSCNIPFAELGMQLGSDTIKNQAEKFGFNQKLSIPLSVTPSTYPSLTDKAQIAQSAFGQYNDRATPLQMAMVSAGIANGGTVMYPNMVESITSSNLQTVEKFSPKVFSQATTSAVASQVSQMMVDGVNKGIATNARISGVSVGGKTGTAQNGSGEPYTLWFTGFAPASNPEYAVAVVVENGGGQGQRGSGNSIAAPIARKVLEAVLNE